MRSIAARQVAETRAASAAELAATTRALLDNAERRLRDAFQALAADALNDNRSSFLDLAKTSFEGYQKPIAESLNRVDQRLKDAERERVEAYSRLSEQVVALGSAASTLSRALRTPAVRGRWGEMQLRRVVEIAGMLQRCDFDEQPPVPIFPVANRSSWMPRPLSMPSWMHRNAPTRSAARCGCTLTPGRYGNTWTGSATKPIGSNCRTRPRWS
jgi:hypothetical protein